MICTNAFVFIHLHKAAGQSINAALQHCMPSAKPIGYHYPAALIPQEYSDLPIVGIIRNPWDWYVSWYAFNNIGGVKNPLFNIVSNGKQADFKTTISNLLCLPNASALSKQMRRTHASLLPAEFGHDQGAGFTAQCVRDMQSDTQGYLQCLNPPNVWGAGRKNLFSSTSTKSLANSIRPSLGSMSPKRLRSDSV